MTQTLHLVTGPPGAGKTSLLNALGAEFAVCPEPARAVLAGQRAIGGRGTGEQDAGLFVELMLARAIDDHGRFSARGGPVLFDRGLPDLLGFTAWYDLADAHVRRACEVFRYARRVFWLAHWPEIYVQDAERRATAQAAAAFGDGIAAAYAACGYALMKVPFGPAAERAAFVRETIAAD